MVTNFEAVLAGSITTGVFALGVALGIALVQGRSARRGERDERRRLAYSQLLAVTGVTLHTAHALRNTVEFRSGLKEGWDVAMHHRKPLDPLELDSHLRRDTEPLYQAWSAVWVVGTQEAIRIANDLVARVSDVVGAATGPGDARSGIIRFMAGEKWSQDQIEAWKTQIAALAKVRRDFVLLARRELGSEVAEVFTVPGDASTPPPAL
jgi:hypothetical protein